MLAALIVFSAVPAVYVSADSYKTTEAAYGTPVVDGVIDSVWDRANYNIIANCRTTKLTEYKGWFKVLWDEEKLYVLAKIYDRKCENVGADWYNDSVDVYIDEDYSRSTPWDNNDYQLRCGWDSVTSGSNNYGSFEKVTTKATTFENGFIAEFSFPFKEKKITEGMKIGFDVQATAAEELGVEMRCYIWNNDINGTWTYNRPDTWGTLILKKTVDVVPFEEPEWTPPKAINGYNETENPVNYEFVTGQTVSVDNVETTHSLLLADDYPLMEIGELAAIVGGTASENTIVKGDVTLTYTAGDRLGIYNGGHLMLEREPCVYNGKLYVPVSSIVTTMLYTTHYNKFGSFLEIWSGNAYPESEITFYAKDFGAVGDGVHYDGTAITKALNAAINCGRPATVALEEGKEYLLNERIDSFSYFLIEDAENITFDGKTVPFGLKSLQTHLWLSCVPRI